MHPIAHRAIAAIVCLLASFVLFLQASGSPYRILIYADGEEIASRVGVLVADELLLTATELVSQGDRIEVVDPSTGARLVATVRSSTEWYTLLSVFGLQGTAARVAAQAPSSGESLHLGMIDGSRREGILHSELEPDSTGSRAYRFSMSVSPEEVGTPVLNSCGNLVAVSWGMLSDSALAVAVGLSGTYAAMVDVLDRESVQYEVSDSPCLSLEEQLGQARMAKEELEANSQTLEDSLNAIVDAISAGGQATQREIAALNVQRNALEDQLAATTAEMARQDSLISEKTTLQAEIETLQADYELLQAELEELEEQSRHHLSIVAALGVVVLGVTLLFLMRAARRRREAEAVLNKTADRLQEVEEENVRRSATYADVLLAGSGPSGEEVRVKLSGAVLAQSENGVILGRSSAAAGCVITEGSVSRKHARIRLSSRGLEIEDLNSLNGTMVNGVRLTPGSPHPLPNGATLAIGDVDLKVTELNR